jgi:hypothetical protein
MQHSHNPSNSHSHPTLPFRHTASADPYQSMPNYSNSGWSGYPGHMSASAPPGGFNPPGHLPAPSSTTTNSSAPKRGRPKAPPRPTQPIRPQPILPAPTPGAHNMPMPNHSRHAPAGAFFHGPTNLPPEPYGTHHPSLGMHGVVPKGPGASAHMQAQHSRLNDRQTHRLPELEARLDRLETAVGRYVDHRGERALEKSHLPGSRSHQRTK